MVVRAVNWSNEGGRIKYMDMPGVKQVDGIWTATHMTMTTKKGKSTLHKTELKFTNIIFNQDLDESMFTVRRLEKGL